MPELPTVQLDLTDQHATCPRGHHDAYGVNVHVLSDTGITSVGGYAATYCPRCATYEKGTRRG